MVAGYDFPLSINSGCLKKEINLWGGGGSVCGRRPPTSSNGLLGRFVICIMLTVCCICRCEDTDEGDLLLHYYTTRPGLYPIVLG